MDERRCAAANCTSRELPTQICPICKAEGIVEGAFFCDKKCFKAAWREHKKRHPPKVEHTPITASIAPGVTVTQTQFGFTVSRDEDAPVGDGSKPRDLGMMGDMMEKLKGLMSANPLPNPEYASQHVKTRDAHPKVQAAEERLKKRLREAGLEVYGTVGVGVGRSLYTAKDFKAGQVLMLDVQTIGTDVLGQEEQYSYLKSVQQLTRNLFRLEPQSRFEAFAEEWCALSPCILAMERGYMTAQQVPYSQELTRDIMKDSKGRERLAYVKSLMDLKDLTSERAVALLVLTAQNNAHTITNPEDESLGDVMSPATCFLNHSCYPNAVVRVVQQGNRKCMVEVRALEDMGPGTEISMTYLGLYKTTEERKQDMMQNHGFVCKCVRCLDPTKSPSALDRMPNIRPGQDGRGSAAKDSRLMAAHRSLDMVQGMEIEAVLCGRSRATTVKNILGKTVQALRSWLQEAVPFYSPLHFIVYRRKQELAGMLLVQEEYDEAMALMEEAHEMAQRVYPPNWFAKTQNLTLLLELHRLMGTKGSARWKELLEERRRLCMINYAKPDIPDASMRFITLKEVVDKAVAGNKKGRR